MKTQKHTLLVLSSAALSALLLVACATTMTGRRQFTFSKTLPR